MGKRSNFERRERDFYPTPPEAVAPLVPHLKIHQRFYEPCAGDGALMNELQNHTLICAHASDIDPSAPFVDKQGAFDIQDSFGATFITNPPWSRDILHPLIIHLSDIAPTWLLFDADWMHTKKAVPYLERCEKIVSVGRVKWIPDSKHTGKDNCCWYLFDKESCGVEFYGRSI